MFRSTCQLLTIITTLVSIHPSFCTGNRKSIWLVFTEFSYYVHVDVVVVYVATPSDDTVNIASHTTGEEEVVVVTGMVRDADPMMVVPVV